MCSHLSLSIKGFSLKRRYDILDLDFQDDWLPVYHSNGFSNSSWPVITNLEPGKIRLFDWGLIPSWTEDAAKAKEIRKKTLNARSETIFEKPSYREPVQSRRCIVPVTGFFEWRSVNNRKIPYHIFLENREIFSLAGIWDIWEDKNNRAEPVKTFSIVTTGANEHMERIHNVKKRMPVILTTDNERRWLSPDLKREDIEALTVPINSDLMRSYTIGKTITSPGSNHPDVLKEVEYPELMEQQALF